MAAIPISVASRTEVTQSAAGEPDQKAAGGSLANQEVSKEMFLELLVAQIKYQNPMNPLDGVQFLSQLAEFSNLEQMLGIREDLAGIREAIEAGQLGPDGLAESERGV